MKLTEKDRALISEAKQIIRVFRKRSGTFHSSVGCALIGDDGRIHVGVNIQSQVSSPASIDAEQGAIMNAYINGMKRIDTIVAVHNFSLNRYEIKHPCGLCREFMKMFGNPLVILSYKEKKRLRELLPY